MTCDRNTTIAQFLDATAARQPVPGGGSVTALAGALASTIGEMVVNYSTGKKGLEAHQSDLSFALAELRRARSMMLDLMEEDQAAYQALSAARKLQRDLGQRDAEYGAALLACIRAPQIVVATAAAVLEICQPLIDKVNRHLLSDLAVCAELSMATVRCGSYNVRVNLPSLDDKPASRRIEDEIDRLTKRSRDLIREMIPRIAARQRSDQ